MNEFCNINALMVQRRRCYINIPMNEFVIANVATMQRRRYYTNIPMNTSITTNVLISQLGTSCVFDSPGLARNEPTPGEYSQGDSTP
ncbi:MAG: tetrahydrofolate synthase [Prevotella salivae]|nr:tetrahydrofolate synthase [Segatella salivae]